MSQVQWNTGLRLVIPVFNDWASFAILLRALDAVAETLPFRITVSAIDDGSTQSASAIFELASSLHFLDRVEIIRLSLNVGHQRAIAIGLCVACEDADFDAILVMDSDGEDPPETIPLLVEQAGQKEEFCIVAARRKRTERISFKISYFIYKTVFKLVTGKNISFGNFSLLSAGFARRLVMIPDLWNNLTAAVLRSRFPIEKISIDRGKRYAGKSQMNFTSLIVHGFSAISVYADTIFVRLLLTTIGLLGLTFVAIVTALVLRLLFPSHATPGWATTVSFGMIIIFLQVLFTTLNSILMLLNNRVQRLVVPAVDFKPYVLTRDPVFSNAGSVITSETRLA
ncbi:MAG TPA: glycosyltransferase [Edaphobacter sp.]|nr:glycosyltransferase [Edaphobacter sp.]